MKVDIPLFCLDFNKKLATLSIACQAYQSMVENTLEISANNKIVGVKHVGVWLGCTCLLFILVKAI